MVSFFLLLSSKKSWFDWTPAVADFSEFSTPAFLSFRVEIFLDEVFATSPT